MPGGLFRTPVLTEFWENLTYEENSMLRKVKQKLIELIASFRRQTAIWSIYDHQRELAYLDSQKFIYRSSGINTITFKDHWDLRRYCIQNISKDGDVFEFGVYMGGSINFIADILLENGDSRVVYGFDSFSGFSEEWSGVDKNYEKGHFDQGGRLPEVRSNVRLVKGYIEETLPKFIEGANMKHVAFVHIDTDTYTPAKIVLERLKKYTRSGTIILFDELCGYPNWRSHEHKALTEVFSESEYEFLGFAQSHSKANLIKAAIRLL